MARTVTVMAVAVVGSPWGYSAAALAGVHVVAAEDAVRYGDVFYLGWSKRVNVAAMNVNRAIGFHCTPLPYGRGGGPIENMILRGHAATVITAFQMNDEMDAGPIYTVRGPISLAGSKEEIQARFIEPVAEMMEWIQSGIHFPLPQIGEPVYFKRLAPDEYRRFWAQREAWPVS